MQEKIIQGILTALLLWAGGAGVLVYQLDTKIEMMEKAQEHIEEDLETKTQENRESIQALIHLHLKE